MAMDQSDCLILCKCIVISGFHRGGGGGTLREASLNSPLPKIYIKEIDTLDFLVSLSRH